MAESFVLPLKMNTFVFLLLIDCVLVSGANTNSAGQSTTPRVQPTPPERSTESTLIDEYSKKICKGEPTCHMQERVPNEMRTLERRKCMCDAECAKYGDCCLDSPYYKEAEQRVNFKRFSCLPTAFLPIYVMATCPSTYSNATVKSKCQLTANVAKDDMEVITLVTDDTNQGITYSNKFCAWCNGVTKFRVWNQTFSCSLPKSQSRFSNGKPQQQGNFDPNAHDFITVQNGKRVVCQLQPPTIPTDVKVRPCIAGTSTCPSGVDSRLCESQTNFGHVVNGSTSTMYKNEHCAKCNGETGVFEHCTSIAPYASLGVLFVKTDVDAVDCENLNANDEIKKKFCK